MPQRRGCVRQPATSVVILFTLLLLSIFPLAASSYSIHHLWKRDSWSMGSGKHPPVKSGGGFQDLGHIDTEHSNPMDDNPDDDSQEPPPSSSSPQNLTQSTNNPGPDTLNTTSLNAPVNSPGTTCSILSSWYTPNLDMIKDRFITDCYLAVQRLYIDDVHFNARANTRTEFVAAPGSNGLPYGFKHTTSWGENVVETPILYEANSCTLAVMMVRTFVRLTNGTAQLPGNFRQVDGLRSSDVSTFRNLHRAGRMVENECLRRWGRGGWMTAGDDQNIGVFLWATNSSVDLQVRPAMESHSFGLLGSGNGTSEELQPKGGGDGVVGGVTSTEGGNATAASSEGQSAGKPASTTGDDTAPRRRRRRWRAWLEGGRGELVE